MKISKRCRLVMVVVLGMVLLSSGEALARHGLPHRFVATTVTHRQVVTNPIAATTTNTAYAPISAMIATLSIPGGSTVLISVRFHAESQCIALAGGVAGRICSVRILIAGIPGEPNQGAGDDFAFDAVSAPVPDQTFWKALAVERHLCVQNARPTPVTIPVIAQSKVSGLATQFRLDEMSLVTERSDRCATDVSGIVTIL